ncbi:ribokinase [Acidithiobacillus sp. M4-SHS-6]|uniref:ribokinase n=1 Tax=Acidithiobacillus sp. M4-SHS-6 TaxID=3383024 RepID=UPI0039BDEAA7
MTPPIVILGAFFVDLACRADRMPVWGETLRGKSFALGPGGKGANQAVAAARQGARVEMITRVGCDTFGDMAHKLFAQEGIGSTFVVTDDAAPTGTATIIVEDASAENAIIIVPGACGRLSVADVEAASPAIAGACFFVSQLELDFAVCRRGMEISSEARVPVLLNPAPALQLPESVYPLVSYLTPNENEASMLVDAPVTNVMDAKMAARVLRDRGVSNVVVTLGEAGAYVSGESFEGIIPAFRAGPVRDTTGAGDAFNGGFVAALAQGAGLREAVQFGCAVAGISVTRPGTSPAMPARHEVDVLLGVVS